MLFVGMLAVIIVVTIYIYWTFVRGTQLLLVIPITLFADIFLISVLASICNASILASPVGEPSHSEISQAIKTAETKPGDATKSYPVGNIIKIALESGTVFTFVEGTKIVKNSHRNVLVTETKTWKNLLFSPFSADKTTQIFYTQLTPFDEEKALLEKPPVEDVISLTD